VIAIVLIRSFWLRPRSRPLLAGLGRSQIAPGLVAAAFLFLAIPYIAFLRVETETWMFSGKLSSNLVTGEWVVEGRAHHDRMWIEQRELFEGGYPIDLFRYIRERGDRFATRILKNGKREAQTLLSFTAYAWMPLAGVGLLTFVLMRRSLLRLVPIGSRQYLIGLVFAVYLSPLPFLLLFYIRGRFLVPYSVLGLMLLAAVIAWLLSQLSKTRSTRFMRVTYAVVAGVVAVVLLFPPNVPKVGQAESLQSVLSNRTPHGPLREAGFWLSQHATDLEQTTVISVRGAQIPMFYAAGKVEPVGEWINLTPFMTLDEASQLVRSGEADYLLLADRNIGDHEDLVNLWRNPASARDFGLELVTDPSVAFQFYQAVRDDSALR